MDYCILKGIIVVYLIQHCTSEDVPSSIQTLTALNAEDESQALTQEQGPAPAEVVPVVAPPSLQEVQQAVQEASEQVEGRGAEEVLKGLLERVVEAALGQVDGAGEAKMDDTAAAIVEEAETGDADGQTGELGDGEVVVDEDASMKQEVVDVLKDGGMEVAVDGNKEITVNEKETKQEVTDILENIERDKQEDETSELIENKETAEDMVVGGEQETNLGPGLADVEQDPVIERTDDAAQTVKGEALEQALDTNLLHNNEMLQAGDIEGNLVEVDAEQVEGEEEKELGDEETVIEGGSIVPKVTDGSEAGEEEQTALETAHGSKGEDQEVLQIADGESHEGAGDGHGEAPVIQNPEQHPEVPPPSPSLSGVEMVGSTPGHEKSSHGNEIVSPTSDQARVHPTLDNAVKDVLVLRPQAEGEQLGEADELVEDATNNGETSELGFEAWKIGAICAAVLLVLETVVIIVYILRNRNKSSSSGQHRACEEGCVEPDATTGGEYNDDTLPAGNGDTQQTAILDQSKVASTLPQNKEQEEMEQVIPMSELLPASEEDTPNSTAEPEPTQDRRTSAL